jgi:hypothetical protein
MAAPDIRVGCSPADTGWSCDVQVGEDVGATRHAVQVGPETLERIGLDATGNPTDLVRSSFEFLLEREPRESILRSFELSVIGRYFPDWERVIRSRLEGR